MAVIATDECGIETDPISIGNIHVPHDQSPREKSCVKSSHEGYRPNEPIPYD